MAPKLLAFHVDAKRALFTPSYMDAYLDRLAGWGYNAILYEIEDKFRFRNHPEIVHPDAPSHEEHRAFVDACRARGLDVIPMMQSLGHLENVVSRNAYAHLREAPELRNHLDASNPASRALVIELFDEIIDVFRPRAFFHMGGDETWQLGKSARLAPWVERNGIGALYLGHMLPIMEHLRQKGLRPMIWADMILTHEEVIPDVPRDIVMVDWDYSATDTRRDSLLVWGGGDPAKGQWANAVLDWNALQTYGMAEKKAFIEQHAVDGQTARDHTFPSFWYCDYLLSAGFDVVTAPATRCHGDTMGIPDNARHLPNCHYFTRKGQEDAMGTIVTSWAVRHSHPEVNLPGALAAARATASERFAPDTFFDAYTSEFFGAPVAGFAGAVAQAGAVTPLAHAYMMERLLPRLREGTLDRDAMRADIAAGLGGEAAAPAALDHILAGYDSAREVFTTMRETVTKNRAHLDFWLEGVHVNTLCANMAKSLLADTLAADRDHLLAACAQARAVTENLFAPTYRPAGLREEADMRYRFFEELLNT